MLTWIAVATFVLIGADNAIEGGSPTWSCGWWRDFVLWPLQAGIAVYNVIVLVWASRRNR